MLILIAVILVLNLIVNTLTMFMVAAIIGKKEKSFKEAQRDLFKAYGDELIKSLKGKG